MPSPGAERRILILGDSHLAAAALAVRAAGAEARFVFFGASGPNFRALETDDRGIAPVTGAAAEEVALVSGGRDRLDTGEFEAAILVGGRLRAVDFLWPMAAHMSRETGAVSGAVLAACARGWAGGRGLRFLRHLFPQGGQLAAIAAPLHIAPEAPGPEDPPALPEGALARLRGAAAVALAARGVTLVQQPEDSVTARLYTVRECGADPEGGDATHVTPALMGRMLDTALEALGERGL